MKSYSNNGDRNRSPCLGYEYCLRVPPTDKSKGDTDYMHIVSNNEMGKSSHIRIAHILFEPTSNIVYAPQSPVIQVTSTLQFASLALLV